MMALDGDQKAYAELLGRYRDAIYFMLLKMVNNKTDAEDLTIEAFGKAFKSIGQYTPAFAFSTWLFKIATNNCIDYLRRKSKSGQKLEDSTVDEDGYDTPLPSDTLDPEERMIHDQKVSLMHTVVAKLKPRYRQLVEMRYFEERSYEEIAEEMKLPIGTVKAQLFRARELLFNILKQKDGHV
ncbi:MAG: RNA polymerase subunit sigma-24 [Bacteroidetes bacterium RIFOXYA12_FULL_35_11]|nr:MAG: RNA polymerase subunit sigma-24 [Bacteroidetes bacterium GWF2_35_48]OFY76653.1 MAG: RNA polymerase subunit sigma-24 [Bacteroidetes bacterium RIFOXYA12_FULL_35_11]OFY96324.1 MAG: RNA polymerase subunit sigma-24 [Bacteroidetes bacterium RIFOXYB2_FULL_35_7]OFZ04946.1 MAG: RNA polymerase subunit sigma-24 [Bacteroidetes bacterium RIFOXYC12_FULL_35_7]HBX51469.1 RNA polymerase subunit sigma-24 [Bacteroidales bacterium]